MFWLGLIILIGNIIITYYPEYRSLKDTGFAVEKTFLAWIFNKFFR